MKDSTHRESQEDERRQEKRDQLVQFLDEVRTDAETESAQYLKETVVPAGGE
jgi:hypothetical protein